jgi:hypothetical protein
MPQLAHLVEGRAERVLHNEVAWVRIGWAEELGQPTGAAATAQEFQRRKDVWTPDPGADDYAIVVDDSPWMLSVMVGGGKAARADLDAGREAWVRTWRERLQPDSVGYLWIYGYAFPAKSAADAADALRVLPDFSPIPPFRPHVLGDAHIGHVYLLAGRTQEALPALRRGAANCRAFDDPFTWVRAALWLGEAEEAAGNKDAACTAYHRVLSHWGHLPQSVTAAEARKHVKGLGCPK